MHRRLQFGMRENPASDRRHGSRQAVRGLSDGDCVQEDSPISSHLPADRNSSPRDVDSEPYAAPPQAATGGEGNRSEERRALTSALVHARATAGFEPLIGSPDAAKLLGDIHVKTLQRYARRGNLPGYRIGSHWYFRASELDSWLRSRLNSSCHPCRLQEESDGT
jgi:excisionase family DNA binding protein